MMTFQRVGVSEGSEGQILLNQKRGDCISVCVGFETGFLCVALTVLELAP